MDQIRATQIIPPRELEQNPYVAPPRDLRLNTKEAESVPTTNSETSISDQANVAVSQGNTNYGDSLGDASQAPPVPHIIGIVEQRVNIHEDGTATIDLVLNIEDVKGITEYDIRVAKDAGNI